MEMNIMTFGSASVPVPKLWQDNSIINYIGPPTDGVQPNFVLTVRKLPGKPKLETYGQNQKEALDNAALKELTWLEEGVVIYEKRRFYRLSYTWVNEATGPDGQVVQKKLHQDQYHLVNDFSALSITFTASAENYSNCAPLFADIVSNTTLNS